MGSWRWAGLFAALMFLVQVEARAHVDPSATSTSCSPHLASQSSSGSSFFHCGRVGTTSVFERNFTCNSGTTCANLLCGGSRVCGASWSNGDTSHGAKGGHKATVEESYCGISPLSCRTDYYP